MAKVLHITDPKTKDLYCLEFTRASVQQMERMGFNADELTDKPATMLPMLFEGAFIAHHSGMKRKEIDAILDKMKNRKELVGKLAEMYAEPIETLLTDPEDSEGNMEWTASW